MTMMSTVQERRTSSCVPQRGRSAGHSKVVSPLAVDPTARSFSQAATVTVRTYNFKGMDRKLRSFCLLEPSEGHQERALWSPSAGLFLAVTGTAQSKVYCPPPIVPTCSSADTFFVT
eukprot:SM000044S16019  [mRNA]  locus=s44:519163:519518:+ [translate_table: standard]